ncbi:OmpA family protein [Phaeovulum sp.]|uniref:OmpA family protein n=1 Tax=Phaeovulum sp. TaxID=2934796 RepID=UPI0039E4AD88
MKPLALIACLAAFPASAQGIADSLHLPTGAEVTATRTSPAASTLLPTGPWTEAGFDRLPLEGAIYQTAWRIRASAQTTLQLLEPLRAQIDAAGFTLLFACETETCGGFDFRYDTETLPEPEMHVDLSDFRYLSAKRDGPDGPEYLGLMVSRSSESGFVNLISVMPLDSAAIQPTAGPTLPAVSAGSVQTAPIAQGLEQNGHVALEDLTFESGSATLAPGEFGSLSALAIYLKANPARQVTLVGHTDAQGALAGNITLSRERADAVRLYLINKMGVPAAQLGAEGAGWLAPRASNLTEEGRAQNRRVEVVLSAA